MSEGPGVRKLMTCPDCGGRLQMWRTSTYRVKGRCVPCDFERVVRSAAASTVDAFVERQNIPRGEI